MHVFIPFLILPHIEPALGAPKVGKNAILVKSKMTTIATIVHQREKVKKIKKFSPKESHLECGKIFDLR